MDTHGTPTQNTDTSERSELTWVFATEEYEQVIGMAMNAYLSA